jgi:hypothetical protein
MKHLFSWSHLVLIASLNLPTTLFADGGDHGVTNGGSVCSQENEGILCDLIDYDNDDLYRKHKDNIIKERTVGHTQRPDLLQLNDLSSLKELFFPFRFISPYFNLNLTDYYITVNPNFDENAHTGGQNELPRKAISKVNRIEITSDFSKGSVDSLYHIELSPKALTLSKKDLVLTIFHEYLHYGPKNRSHLAQEMTMAIAHNYIYPFIKIANSYLSGQDDINLARKKIYSEITKIFNDQNHHFPRSNHFSCYHQLSCVTYVQSHTSDHVFFVIKPESKNSPHSNSFIIKDDLSLKNTLSKKGDIFRYVETSEAYEDLYTFLAKELFIAHPEGVLFLNIKDILLLKLMTQNGQKLSFKNKDDLEENIQQFKKSYLQKEQPLSLGTNIGIGQFGHYRYTLFDMGLQFMNPITPMNPPSAAGAIHIQLAGSERGLMLMEGDLSYSLSAFFSSEESSAYAVKLNMIKMSANRMNPLKYGTSEGQLAYTLETHSPAYLFLNDDYYFSLMISPLKATILLNQDEKVLGDGAYSPSLEAFFGYQNLMTLNAEVTVLPFEALLGFQGKLQGSLRPLGRTSSFKLIAEGAYQQNIYGQKDMWWTLGVGFDMNSPYVTMPFIF